MTQLSFDRKCLNDDAIAYICHFENLVSLSIYNDKCASETQLTGGNFELLSLNKKIEHLDFDYNSIKIENLSKLNALKNLKSLKLIGNDIGSQNIRELVNLNVESIVLGHNNWDKALIKDITYFLTKTKITNVSFGGVSDLSGPNELAASVVVALGELKKLNYLKTLSIPIELDSKTFVNLLNLQKLNKLSFNTLLDSNNLNELEENATLVHLDANIPPEILPLIKNIKLLDRVIISTLDQESIPYYTQSSVKKLLITQRVINLEHLMDLIRSNSDKQIQINIFSYFLKSSEDGPPATIGDVASELLEVCKPNQCFVFSYGNAQSIEDYLKDLQ